MKENIFKVMPVTSFVKYILTITSEASGVFFIDVFKDINFFILTHVLFVRW